MRKIFMVTAVAASFATPVVALEYLCSVRDIGNGFISQQVGIKFEPGARTAMVYDGIIHAVHAAPLEVRQKDRGNGKYRFTYQLNNIPAKPTPADINYRIELDTKTNALTMRGLIPGVLNMIAGKGQCQKTG